MAGTAAARIAQNGRARADGDQAMGKFIHTLKHELHEMIAPTVYFFIILHLVEIIRVLLNEGSGMQLATTASIAIAALVLGKAVLIANALPFINRYPDRPLAWNVGWKTVLYLLVATLIHYLERLYDGWRTAGSLVKANEARFATINWPHFWAVEIMLAILILAYCATVELSRELGESRLRAMFFGPLPAPGKPAPRG